MRLSTLLPAAALLLALAATPALAQPGWGPGPGTSDPGTSDPGTNDPGSDDGSGNSDSGNTDTSGSGGTDSGGSGSGNTGDSGNTGGGWSGGGSGDDDPDTSGSGSTGNADNSGSSGGGWVPTGNGSGSTSSGTGSSGSSGTSGETAPRDGPTTTVETTGGQARIRVSHPHRGFALEAAFRLGQGQADGDDTTTFSRHWLMIAGRIPLTDFGTNDSRLNLVPFFEISLNAPDDSSLFRLPGVTAEYELFFDFGKLDDAFQVSLFAAAGLSLQILETSVELTDNSQWLSLHVDAGVRIYWNGIFLSPAFGLQRSFALSSDTAEFTYINLTLSAGFRF